MPRSLPRLTLSLLTSLLLLPQASAQDAVSEQDFLAELPVVLSASRLRQPVDEAPAAVTVISREMIEASGVREIPELLRLVPGMVVGQPNSFRTATSQHGLTSSMSRRMQILVDGRSITSPVFGGVLWTDIPLSVEDVERIEVVRGPNAASYGSSAMLGVINITTRHAARDRGSRGVVRVGDNGIHDGYVRYGDQQGDLDWRLSLEYLQDDGMAGPANGHAVQRAMLRTDYQFDTRNRLLAQGGFNAANRDIESVNPAVPFRTQDTDAYLLQLRWEHVKPDGSDLWLQAFRSSYDLSQPLSFVFSTLPGAPVDERPWEVLAVRSDIELQDTQRLTEGLRLVWGGGLRRDEITAERAFGTPDTIHMDYLRLFGHLEWQPDDRWLVNLGGMYERHEFTGDGFSPRLAINYRLRPAHTLRLAASQASRVPVAYEEMADLTFSVDTPSGPVINQAYVSSGGLDAERITSYEIGYLGHYLDRRLDVDARLYHERLSGLIARQLVPVSDYNGFLLDYIGADHADVSGAELQLDYRVARRHFYRLAYAYTRVDSDDIAQPLSDSAPEHLLTLFGTFPLPRGLQGTASYHYSSGHTYLTDFDGGLGGVPLDPIHRVDLRLSYPFRHGASRNALSLVVQSALGDYHDYDNAYAFPRRLWLELAVEMP